LGEACPFDLTAPVGLSQPTVSRHLKVLYEAGLVFRRSADRGHTARPGPLADVAVARTGSRT
jgi:ArsR family transcriptional regulator